ncbi:MAG: DegV family protein [Candidatus Thorarchaeota archaeon]
MALTAIVTDGVNDLSQDMIDEYDITVIPYRIMFGEEVHRIWHNDKCTISLEDFCSKITKCSKEELPSTSVPTPLEFHEAFNTALGKASSVIAVFQAAKMSGTVNIAQSVANNGYKNNDIAIFDSKRIMTGSGIQALEAAKMAKKGSSKNKILLRLEAINPRVRTILIMNDLNYLYLRGRIGRAKKLLGSAMNMIPSIAIEEGVPTALGTFKGTKNLSEQLQYFCSKIIEQTETNDIFITHINHHALTQEIVDLMNDKNDRDISIHYKEAGPIMGVYSGPKAICISYIGNWNKKWLIK